MTTAKRRILSAINRLALRPMRIATNRLTAKCEACLNPIRTGDQYRNAGSLKTHENCFQAMAREFKEGRS